MAVIGFRLRLLFVVLNGFAFLIENRQSKI
jgi:hypothetical protein